MILSYSKSFDFRSLNRMTIDNLIWKCREYVEKYLSKSVASRLDKAYKASRFDEIKFILEKTLNQINGRVNTSESQNNVGNMKEKSPDINKIFVYFDNNEGSQDDSMETDSGTVAVIILIVAILVVGILFLKFKDKNIDVNNMTVGEIRSYGLKKDNSIKYTDMDKDFVELIHELSIIYDNIDQFLKG